MLNGLHRSINKTWHFISRRPISLRCFIQEKDAPAQGMVEFALVLPILLLVIFGIVAFGHFFFNYSLVVAASREAARFGTAVGLTENSLPRYRDCNLIRAAAASAGGFAGIDGSDTSVTITYDKGPRKDPLLSPEEVKDASGNVIHCPTNGIGPGSIELGDRIVVTVQMLYKPIVPLIPMTDMPLTATTRRTIMLGMPVGDQPLAESSVCVGTLTRIIPPSWDPTLVDQNGVPGGSYSRIGEPVSFEYETITDEIGKTAQGMIHFYENDVMYNTPVCSHAAPADECTRTYNTLTGNTPIILRAQYLPGTYATTTPCFIETKAEPIRHYVISAETDTKILPLASYVYKVGDTVEIFVEVTPEAPAEVGTPTGQVIVSGEGAGETCTINLVPDSTQNKSSGSCLLTFTTMNNRNTITAVYDKDPGTDPLYNSSSATLDNDIDVNKADDPSPELSCPAFQSLVQFDGTNMTMYIDNGMNYDIGLDRIRVTWGTSVNLVNVYKGASTTPIASGKYGPGTADLTVNTFIDLTPAVTQLRFVFDAEIPAGSYTVEGVLGSRAGSCPSPVINTGTKYEVPYP